MFKGTTNIEDTKGIARKFDEIGAYFNAYTDKNVTCYTVKSSNIHIDIIIKTLADMLVNSLFLEKEFEMEKSVVTEEIIRAIDNTANHINNEIYTLYFKGNNLANPIGGYPRDIKNYNYEESKKYFKTFYTPGNMVLSICTDLPFSNIKNIISESYLITTPSKPFNNTLYTNLNPIEIMTLASIVQKETPKVDERPTIAGVYLNRLDRRMKLQADPTVVYTIKKRDGFDTKIRRVLYKDLRIKSPYNTYINRGLPPGPIVTPDISAIEAVLNPSSHKFIYFVADVSNPGYHLFSKTNAEHNQKKRQYTKWLKERNIRR